MKILHRASMAALLGVFALTNPANGQSFTDFAWKETTMQSGYTIPEEYKAADAVIIRTETYSKGVFSGEFPYIEQLGTLRSQTHLKIQTAKALESYQRLAIPRFRGQIADYVQLKEFDVRIRKKDGKQIDYVVKDLPKLELTEDDKMYESREDYYFYELKDLEIGDEIETVSVIESKFLDNGRIATLYQEYPTLESRFVISVPNKVKLIGSVYNKMPSPEIRSAGEQNVYTWVQKNLQAIPEANTEGTIFTKTLPYFIYELNFDAFRGAESFIPKNYRDLGIQYLEDFLTVRVNKKAKLDEFYANLLKDKTTNIDKVSALNEYLTKQVKIVGRRDLSETEGVDDYLLNKRTDGMGIMKIYYDFFTRTKMPFYLGFAKNRFDGDFDVNFLTSTQIADYFFVFESEEGSLFTVMGMNGINEIPSSLVGVPFYLINLKDRNKKDLESFQFPEDILKEMGDNVKIGRTTIELKLADNSANVKLIESLSGCYATDSRGGMVNMMKKDSLVKFFQGIYDNQYKSFEPVVTAAAVKEFEVLPPYPFKSEHMVTFKNVLKKKDDAQLLELKRFLGHNTRYTANAEARVLDYYVDFVGKEVEDIVISFDKEVTIANLSELNVSVSNEFGSYTCIVAQPKPTMLQIKSTYIVKQLMIDKDKVKELDAVNKAYEKVRDLKLQIKAK